MKRKTLIVVDMRTVMEEHMRRKALYSFFAKFSLHDLIESVLSVSPYIDYSQHIYDALDMRFEDDDIGIDMDLFIIFYEALMTDIDTAVVEQYMLDFQEIKSSTYTFKSWIDKTSLLLQLE